MTTYHQPVLLKNCIEGLNCKEDGIYVDVTFGGGGHSKAILASVGMKGKLIAFDQDRDAAVNAPIDKRFTLIPQNFRYLRNFIRDMKIKGVDGILADLGLSSHQLDQSERGFAFRHQTKLDMRMNQNAKKTAADVINLETPENLIRIFRMYGEIENAGRLGHRLVEERGKRPIHYSAQLIEICKELSSPKKENQYLARVFQALRIEVNQELDALKELLEQTLEILNPCGRLVIMSYHSLEDRMVKNFMRTGNIAGSLEKDFYGNPLSPFIPLTKKPITPTENEISENSRARSAKLRIAEKKIEIQKEGTEEQTHQMRKKPYGE